MTAQFRPIHYYGDPVLREVSTPVDPVDENIRSLAADMILTMRESSGVGLAAQQIGETRSICVVEVPPEMDEDHDGNRLHPDLEMPMVLINPVLSEPTKKTDSMEEGCLSFPEIRGSINRPYGIHLAWTDLEGKRHERDIRGFLARVIQHEVDHLNGVLFIDRMSSAKRFTLAKKLKRLREDTRTLADV